MHIGGTLQLTCHAYYELGRRLIGLAGELCDGRLIMVLEGGYDPAALGASVEATLCALAALGPPQDPFGPAPRPEPDVQDLVRRVVAQHGL